MVIGGGGGGGRYTVGVAVGGIPACVLILYIFFFTALIINKS